MEIPRLRIPSPLAARADAIQALLEPCVDLRVEPRGTPAAGAGSRLFGSPLLHHVGDWPRTPEGAPMLFVAQVDLADAARLSQGELSGLPSSGMLSLFYDLDSMPRGGHPEDRYRFRVLWTPEPSGGRVISPPKGAPGIGAPETTLAGAFGWRLPSEVDSRFTLGDLGEQEFLAYSSLAGSLMPACEHRLMGPADWLECDARPLCAGATADVWGGRDNAASSWRLLLQIGGEPGISEALGDDAALYVMIRQEDLAERRFIRSWVVLQGG